MIRNTTTPLTSPFKRAPKNPKTFFGNSAENRGKSCQRQLMRICIFCGTVTKNPVTLEKVEKIETPLAFPLLFSSDYLFLPKNVQMTKRGERLFSRYLNHQPPPFPSPPPPVIVGSLLDRSSSEKHQAQKDGWKMKPCNCNCNHCHRAHVPNALCETSLESAEI